jgi:hypothetical protein
MRPGATINARDLDRLLLTTAVLAVALSGVAGAQDGAGESPLATLESWITVEDEQAPDPPIFRSQAGLLAWVHTRSSLGVDGAVLKDLEEEQGLVNSGIGPWLEFTVGSTLRLGLDGARVERLGRREVQAQPVFFEGRLVADAGDSIRASNTFLTVGALLEWDILYAEAYRIGVVGGARYFRLDTTLRGFGPTGVTRARNSAELISPFFGGQIEVTPFPYLTVYTRIQFMNWSWDTVGLKEARFLEFRLGVRINVAPRTLALSLEYRWMSVRAQGSEGEEGGLGASGLVAALNLSF